MLRHINMDVDNPLMAFLPSWLSHDDCRVFKSDPSVP